MNIIKKYFIAIVIIICTTSCTTSRYKWNDLYGNPPEVDKLEQAFKDCDYDRKMQLSQIHLENIRLSLTWSSLCTRFNLKQFEQYEEPDASKCQDYVCREAIESEKYKTEACSCMMEKGFLQGLILDPNN